MANGPSTRGEVHLQSASLTDLTLYKLCGMIGFQLPQETNAGRPRKS